ncbi:MAG: hypothetical protein ACM3WS_05135 [Bacillota bacterium]
MDILKKLRVIFPGAQAWHPGYQALLDLLVAGEPHVPGEAKKSGQNDPGQTGCRNRLPLCGRGTAAGTA